MKGMLHAWRIEDREYARQEKRRGRRHAFKTLEPARTALVVIDMVPFVTPRGEAAGLGFPGRLAKPGAPQAPENDGCLPEKPAVVRNDLDFRIGLAADGMRSGARGRAGRRVATWSGTEKRQRPQRG